MTAIPSLLKLWPSYFSALGNAEQINDLESAIKGSQLRADTELKYSILAIESIVLSASHQNDGSLAKEKVAFPYLSVVLHHRLSPFVTD